MRLVFDALVLPRHLPRLARVLERHPELPVVVDHGAKPRIRDGEIVPWRADMAVIAAHPRVDVQALRPRDGSAGQRGARRRCGPTSTRCSSSSGRDGCYGAAIGRSSSCAGGYDRWHDLAQEALSGSRRGRARRRVRRQCRAGLSRGERGPVPASAEPPKRAVRPLGGSERSERGGRSIPANEHDRRRHHGDEEHERP